MDLAASIATMSVSLHQASLQNSISTAVLGKTMDVQKSQGETLIQDLTNTALPAGSLGSLLDTRA